MKLHVIYFIPLFLLMGCAINKDIIKKRDYVFKNDAQRKLILTFQNDSDCTLKDVYTANNTHKELVIHCKYKTLSNQSVVLLNNDRAYVDTSGAGYFYFPPLNRNDTTLAVKSKQTFIIGPNYPSDYGKHAKVPFVDRDTLINNRGKLHWIKKNKNNKVVGYYVFK
ncbi:hypothetical protein [Mucilaginibacter segetis]|uniref:Lipoprotein n=1 Tax=Mucilaginibacter segetis TaxID=2793071 RepID=A0A934PQG8_9SPHI|nr:hypothetical protein [Mucilaginibacter segetis]MBK0378873.1 hypothetical protein [Mucilaginibacter segetis]